MNKCILIGRLTADPTLRHTQTDKAVTTFTLAVNRRGKDQGADFIDIVCWDKLAEFVSSYFTKGRQIAIEGRLQQRKWEDKDGNKRTSYEVVANEAHFADSKPQSSGNDYGNSYGAPQQQPVPRANNDYYDAPAASPASDSTGFTELMEDDGQLPF